MTNNSRDTREFFLGRLKLKDACAPAGYAYEPYKVPTRIVTLMLLVASLSLYAAYTANIVGLLQSSTDSIQTIPDLLHSPLKMGAQDVVYNRYYFKVGRSTNELQLIRCGKQARSFLVR